MQEDLRKIFHEFCSVSDTSVKGFIQEYLFATYESFFHSLKISLPKIIIVTINVIVE